MHEAKLNAILSVTSISVAISWGNKMNFSLSANMSGFCLDSHICTYCHHIYPLPCISFNPSAAGFHSLFIMSLHAALKWLPHLCSLID